MTDLSNKIGILKDALMGNLMKLKVVYDIRLRKAVGLSSRQENSVIVSLTSYGNRVKGSAVYTVYSLLRQRVRPERVVLWLDEKEFNSQNLPDDLRFLCDYGLEVRFGKDIGPYTKIIHSLSAFPDKHIITADDDLYYTRTFVEEFVEAHRQHPQAIITAWGKMPTLEANGKPATYDAWPEYHRVPQGFEYDVQTLFPMGVGGVLTFKKSHLPEVLPQVVPLNRIVLETDAPYMAPVPMRGQRNEPAYIRYVLQRMAQAYGINEDELAAHTNENVERVFGVKL